MQFKTSWHLEAGMVSTDLRKQSDLQGFVRKVVALVRAAPELLRPDRINVNVCGPGAGLYDCLRDEMKRSGLDRDVLVVAVTKDARVPGWRSHLDGIPTTPEAVERAERIIADEPDEPLPESLQHPERLFHLLDFGDETWPIRVRSRCDTCRTVSSSEPGERCMHIISHSPTQRCPGRLAQLDAPRPQSRCPDCSALSTKPPGEMCGVYPGGGVGPACAGTLKALTQRDRIAIYVSGVDPREASSGTPFGGGVLAVCSFCGKEPAGTAVLVGSACPNIPCPGRILAARALYTFKPGEHVRSCERCHRVHPLAKTTEGQLCPDCGKGMLWEMRGAVVAPPMPPRVCNACGYSTAEAGSDVMVLGDGCPRCDTGVLRYAPAPERDDERGRLEPPALKPGQPTHYDAEGRPLPLSFCAACGRFNSDGPGASCTRLLSDTVREVPCGGTTGPLPLACTKCLATALTSERLPGDDCPGLPDAPGYSCDGVLQLSPGLPDWKPDMDDGPPLSCDTCGHVFKHRERAAGTTCRVSKRERGSEPCAGLVCQPEMRAIDAPDRSN